MVKGKGNEYLGGKQQQQQNHYNYNLKWFTVEYLS